jgi:hypothetical protein
MLDNTPHRPFRLFEWKIAQLTSGKEADEVPAPVGSIAPQIALRSSAHTYTPPLTAGDIDLISQQRETMILRGDLSYTDIFDKKTRPLFACIS